MIGECVREWDLEIGMPFEPATVSFVAPVTLRDGERAVLKINFPEAESEHEADALAHWSGRGAVRLLAADPERRALLVERCEPGDQLWSVADEEEANRIGADVLRQLWQPAPEAHRFRRLAAEADRWADRIPAQWDRHGRPFEQCLVEESVLFLRSAAKSRSDVFVLHQDFNGGNVLRSGRGWLAIDPKPLVGEREFDTASLLRDRRGELATDPQPVPRMRRRLDQLSAELGLDRDRMRGWAIAHALAWGVSRDGWLDDMVACARWLSES